MKYAGTKDRGYSVKTPSLISPLWEIWLSKSIGQFTQDPIVHFKIRDMLNNIEQKK